ncbi:MAG: methyltransferase domain-containing protein [Erythrobacter sp.]|nr:MAG: methyltransferase domain-containing protein [Erythrobacter sp.]
MDKPPPTIFSRRQATAKWARSQQRNACHNGTSFLSDEMAEDVLERLDFIRMQPKRALFVGDLTGLLTSTFHDRNTAVSIGLLGAFDEERPAERGGYDLIVHLRGLGHVNDLPGALIHARHALAEDGLFIAAFPGAGSLPALRRIAMAADGERVAPRMHPLIGNQAAAALLQRAGFRKQVVDSYPINLRYGAFSTMVSDLRDHGLTRALATPSPPWTKAGLARAEAEFEAMRDAEGKVPEVIEILVMSGWR